MVDIKPVKAFQRQGNELRPVGTVNTGNGIGGTSNHAQLSNLDFTNSGHTGFANTQDIEDLKLEIQALTGFGVDPNSPHATLPPTVEENTIYLVGTAPPYVMWLLVGGTPHNVGTTAIDIQQALLNIWRDASGNSVGEMQDFLNWIKAVAGGHGNIGEIFWWPTEMPPNDALYCNGGAISRVDYADLFSVIGTNFGAGDGSTTFNLPDMRGQFVRGFDPTNARDPSGNARGFGSNQAPSTVLNINAWRGSNATAAQANATFPFPTTNNTSLAATNTDGFEAHVNSRVALQSSWTDTNAWIPRYRVRPTNINLLPCIRYRIITHNPLWLEWQAWQARDPANTADFETWLGRIIHQQTMRVRVNMTPRGATASTWIPLSHTVIDGDSSMSNGTRFIAPVAGQYILTVSSATATEVSPMIFQGIMRNSDVADSSSNRVSVSQGHNGRLLPSVMTTCWLEKDEFLTPHIFSTDAQTSTDIHNGHTAEFALMGGGSDASGIDSFLIPTNYIDNIISDILI